MHRDSFNTALKYITYLVDDTLKPGYKCGMADEKFFVVDVFMIYLWWLRWAVTQGREDTEDSPLSDFEPQLRSGVQQSNNITTNSDKPFRWSFSTSCNIIVKENAGYVIMCLVFLTEKFVTVYSAVLYICRWREKLFSCEEAALEGQMLVCLCVCVSDPKTEFHLSSFNSQV